MPFYEYECTNCKFYVEVLQKISSEPLKKCPSCKKQTMKRLISAPVFRLKGEGWYETDFKAEGEDKRNLAAGDDEPAEAKPEEAKADAAKDEKADKADKTDKADKADKAGKADKSDRKDAARGAKKPPAKPAAQTRKPAAQTRKPVPKAKPTPKKAAKKAAKHK